MLRYISIFFISILFVSCAEFENGVQETDPKPVVEGYLIPGVQVTIRIHKEIPYTADSTANKEVPIDGLAIKLTGPNSSVTLISKGSGLYQAPADFAVKVGGVYSLNFDYHGKAISAITKIPSKPVQYAADKTIISRQAVNLTPGFNNGTRPGGFGGSENSITLTWSNPDNDYFISVVENLESNPVEIIKFPVDTTRVRPNIRFRNEPIQGTVATIRSQSFQYFGHHRIVLFKLNPDYVALYQRNGNTTQNISTPPTTINNGLGIFTGVNADTLFVRVIPE